MAVPTEQPTTLESPVTQQKTNTVDVPNSDSSGEFTVRGMTDQVKQVLASPLALSQAQELVLANYTHDLQAVVNERSPVKRALLRNVIHEKYRTVLGFSISDVKAHVADVLMKADEESVKTRFNLAEILSLSEEIPDYLSPPLVRDGGGLYLLYARAKVGKTLLTYNMAYSVAVSGNFLGLPCHTGNVWIIQTEESKGSISRRLRGKGFEKFNEDMEQAIRENRVLLDTTFDLQSDLHKKFRDTLINYKPRLVIIDSLRSITNTMGVSENSQEIAKPFYALQRMLNTHGVTGIVIHHASRAGNSSGSSALEGANDGMMVLDRSAHKREGHGDLIELKTVPRDGIPIHYLLERTTDQDTYYWEFQLIEELGVDISLVKMEKRVVALLARRSPATMTRQELAVDLGVAQSDQVFNQCLVRLVESCQVLADRGILQPADPDTGTKQKIGVTYRISENNPLVKFDETSYAQHINIVQQLLEAHTTEEVRGIFNSFKENEDTRKQVWTMLSAPEREYVLRLYDPPYFKEGDFVRHTLTDDIYQVTAVKYETVDRCWVFQVNHEDDNWLTADLLRFDPDYSPNTINLEGVDFNETL